MGKQKCIECPYFRIVQDPIRAHGGGYWDLGRARCYKLELVVDFMTRGKLKKLECVETENAENESGNKA